MRQFKLLLAGMAVLMFTAGLSGCADSSTSDQSASSQTDNGSETEPAGHSDDVHADHVEAEEIKETLAKLSGEDRAAAEKQKVCPVSGEALGSMGAPIKMNVKDTDVWICCDGCKDQLTGDPDTYLAKLKQE